MAVALLIFSLMLPEDRVVVPEKVLLPERVKTEPLAPASEMPVIAFVLEMFPVIASVPPAA